MGCKHMDVVSIPMGPTIAKIDWLVVGAIRWEVLWGVGHLWLQWHKMCKVCSCDVQQERLGPHSILLHSCAYCTTWFKMYICRSSVCLGLVQCVSGAGPGVVLEFLVTTPFQDYRCWPLCYLGVASIKMVYGCVVWVNEQQELTLLKFWILP